ncbi:expressed unknown protein [Seminavis robusta]|uniref:DUF6824 domain-containing protein n=1 Tax=Seminavis robusta TaxID=568900 RepID=A0A9N8EKA3_9STRA|nr:expressed unknown protein [Seminavis robusta]|eukprot:Sro1287_g259500.1 n/a (214) ;mRNA; r:26752-27393
MSETGFAMPFIGYHCSFYWYMNSLHVLQTPCDNDVILGRGGKKHKHGGNVQLQNMALEMACQYMKASKLEKGRIAEHLVHRVHQYGGRFMEQTVENGPWQVVSFDKAKAKARDVLHSILVDPNKQLRGRIQTFSVDGNPFAGLEDGTWTHLDEGMGGDAYTTSATCNDNNAVMESDSYATHDMEFPDFEALEFPDFEAVDDLEMYASSLFGAW